MGCLTGEQQDQTDGKEVGVLRQPRGVHAEVGLTEPLDVSADQLVERPAPRPRHRRRT